MMPEGFKIDFVRKPVSGSAESFFCYYPKFFLTAIDEIKMCEKKFLTPKKFIKE